MCETERNVCICLCGCGCVCVCEERKEREREFSMPATLIIFCFVFKLVCHFPLASTNEICLHESPNNIMSFSSGIEKIQHHSPASSPHILPVPLWKRSHRVQWSGSRNSGWRKRCPSRKCQAQRSVLKTPRRRATDSCKK